MLGDVEVDWSMSSGYGIRSMHQTDGKTDDLLVCIPLPPFDALRAGAHRRRGRYRMSMLVPPELSGTAGSSERVAHGFEGERKPALHHIQAVLDRLFPEPTTACNMRWSSVFRIATASSTPMGRVGCSSRATPRTSTRRPARRV